MLKLEKVSNSIIDVSVEKGVMISSHCCLCDKRESIPVYVLFYHRAETLPSEHHSG